MILRFPFSFPPSNASIASSVFQGQLPHSTMAPRSWHRRRSFRRAIASAAAQWRWRGSAGDDGEEQACRGGHREDFVIWKLEKLL